MKRYLDFFYSLCDCDNHNKSLIIRLLRDVTVSLVGQSLIKTEGSTSSATSTKVSDY